MNTEKQIDALFEDIIQSKNSIVPKAFEYNSLLKIKKFKLQLYFKERFTELLKKGTIKYSSKPEDICSKVNNNYFALPILDISILEKSNILEIADIIKKKPDKLLRLLTNHNISIQSFSDYLQISDLKRIYKYLNQIYQKQFQVSSPKLKTKNIIVAKEIDLSIYDICNKSIKDVADYLSYSSHRIIKKTSSYLQINNINEDFILTSDMVELLYDYLNNLFHIKNRRNQQSISTNTEWNSKRKNEKFKPSLGREGNYKKLIYIRTKS